MILAFLSAAFAGEPGYLELDVSGGGSYASAVEAQPAGAIGLIAHPSPAWGVQMRLAGHAAVGRLAQAAPFTSRYGSQGSADEVELTRIQGSLGAALVWAPRRKAVDPYALLGAELVLQRTVFEERLADFAMIVVPPPYIAPSPVAGLGLNVWLSDAVALQFEARGGLLIQPRNRFFDDARVTPRAEGAVGLAFAPGRSRIAAGDSP